MKINDDEDTVVDEGGDYDQIEEGISDGIAKLGVEEEVKDEDDPKPPEPDDTIEIEGVEYSREQIAEIMRAKATASEPPAPVKPPEESAKIKALMERREAAKGDEEIVKVIDELIEIRKEVESDRAEKKAKDEKEKGDEAYRHVREMANAVEEKYGIKLPDPRSPAFKIYMDTSNAIASEENYLERAVEKLHPGKFNGRGPVKVPGKMPRPKVPAISEAPDDMDPEIYAKIVEKAKIAGVSVKSALKNYRTY